MADEQDAGYKEVAFDTLPISAKKLQRALQTIEQEQAQLKKEKSLINRTASVIKKHLAPQPVQTPKVTISAPAALMPKLSRSTSAPISRSYAGSSASSASSNTSLPNHSHMPPGPPPSRTKKTRLVLATGLGPIEPESPWAPPPCPPKRIRTPPRPQLKSIAKSAPPPVHGYPRTMQDKRHLSQTTRMPDMPTLQIQAPKAIRPVPPAKSALKAWEQIGPWQQTCFFAKRYIVKEEHPYGEARAIHYHLEAETPFTPEDASLARRFAVMSIVDELNCATLRRICEVYEDPKAWVVIKNSEIIDIVCKRAEVQLLYGSELVLK